MYPVLVLFVFRLHRTGGVFNFTVTQSNVFIFILFFILRTANCVFYIVCFYCILGRLLIFTCIFVIFY